MTINAGSGNDSIGNHGGPGVGNTLIDAGDGDDTIDNHIGNVTLKGGTGNDSIYNGNDDYVSISGGDGADTIENCGRYATGGKGNDLVSLGTNAQNALIQYASSDGNDIIRGFNNSSTLSISGANYISQKSGNDVIVTVGENKITLDGAATLATVNIQGNGQVNYSADFVASLTIGSNTPTVYNSLQDAFNAAIDAAINGNQYNSRITLLQDTTGSLDFTNFENVNNKWINININLNKKTFTTNDTIELNKNVFV